MEEGRGGRQLVERGKGRGNRGQGRGNRGGLLLFVCVGDIVRDMMPGSWRKGSGMALGLRHLFLGVCVAAMLGGDAAKADIQCLGTPCVLGEHTGISQPRNETIISAVGCEQEFSVTFGSAYFENADIEVGMCARSVNGICVNKLNSITSIDDELLQCCSSAIQDRTCRGLSELVANDPLDFFKCALFKVQRRPGNSTATVRFVTPYFADLSNADFYQNDPELLGRHEICFFAKEMDRLNVTVESVPYCVQIQVQTCSACLREGEGLNTLAKKYGTQWTQIYSSNQDIMGNPNDLETGRLLRLGPVYEVQSGDTPISIALKMGVTVNQLFFWNKHLALVQEPMKSMPEGSKICVLPKTCFNSFGDEQVVFNHREIYHPVEGGAWQDPYQVDPQVFVDADPRLGPGATPPP